MDQAAVEAALRAVAGTASGSVVAFDYCTTAVLESRALNWRFACAPYAQ